jgi:hypothetical protein
MKRLVIKPVGWPCPFGQCTPGLFVHGISIGIKGAAAEGEKPLVEVLWGDNGDSLLPGSHNSQIEVQPVIAEWEEYDG